jgi:hypothetical protein
MQILRRFLPYIPIKMTGTGNLLSMKYNSEIIYISHQIYNNYESVTVVPCHAQ